MKKTLKFINLLINVSKERGTWLVDCGYERSLRTASYAEIGIALLDFKKRIVDWNKVEKGEYILVRDTLSETFRKERFSHFEDDRVYTMPFEDCNNNYCASWSNSPCFSMLYKGNEHLLCAKKEDFALTLKELTELAEKINIESEE